MANKPISADTPLAAGSIATGDLIPVVDVSEPLAADKNKSVTFTTLTTYFQTNLSFEAAGAVAAHAGGNSHIDWTTDQGATNIHAGNYTNTVYTHPNHSGDVTSVADGAQTIATNAVTYSKFQQSSVGFTVLGKTATGAGNFAEIVAGTDSVLRRSGSGNLSFGTIVTNNIATSAVTLAKMANVETSTVFYRKTASTGVPEVQTLATLKTDLGLTGTNSGDNAVNTLYSGLVSDTGVPALLSSGGLPVLNTGITGAEVRTAIGAGTSSTTGTVTSTSVVTANGVSGTVATSTTTPAITLTVDHDAISNFVANEHIDWTSTSQNLSTSGGITGNNYIVGSASGGISNSINNGYIYYAGGNSSLAGANIWMYGGTHASQANDFVFKGSTTTALQYDHSATTWDFQSNAITTSGSATVGSLVLGGAVTNSVDDTAITIYGGTSASWLSQSGIEIFGSGFSSVANDIVFFGTSVDEKLRWDNSAGTWVFYYPINADTINETTAAAGVTIEGVLHKDNAITTTGLIRSADNVYAGNTLLTVDDQFFVGALSATVAAIQFDNADTLRYDRTNNVYGFYIGAEAQFNLSLTEANFANNNIITTGTVTTGDLTVEGADFYIKEQAYSATSLGGYGHIWVENTAPTKLWYRNDTGNDFQLGVNVPVNHGTAYPSTNLGYTGVIENFITGATVTAGYAVALMADTVRAEVQHADADVLAPPVGIAITGGTAGTKIDVLVKGVVKLTGLQYGVGAAAVAYVSTTAGYITPTVPATTGQYVFIMGYGLATDVMYVNPQFNWVEVS